MGEILGRDTSLQSAVLLSIAEEEDERRHFLIFVAVSMISRLLLRWISEDVLLPAAVASVVSSGDIFCQEVFRIVACVKILFEDEIVMHKMQG